MSEITQPTAPVLIAMPGCPEWQEAALQQAKTTKHDHEPERARVFISYKRNAPIDESVAENLFRAINQHHDVFIDKTMLVGTDWATCIETKIRESDFLISLLSEQSVNSEMVKGEIEKAHFFGKEQGGRPAILPVRLDYNAPFPYSVSP